MKLPAVYKKHKFCKGLLEGAGSPSHSRDSAPYWTMKEFGSCQGRGIFFLL